ncbi:MAG: gamma-glutamylcyclotransferase [Symploca sp. SIO2B6]|nr:gamma-glutamylcyclotransferase [Symploca sp. SIO2B6]
MNYLFVYGTLRSPINHAMHQMLADHACLVGIGFMHGRLFNLGTYPGAVFGGDKQAKVWGEVYRLKPEVCQHVLDILDDYEGCSTLDIQQAGGKNEYCREQVSITLSYGQALLAWVYLYNRDTTLLDEIPSGDYCEFVIAR